MDECHGLLVTHLDGRVECLDDDCLRHDGPRHEWRASCSDVPGLCRCADTAGAEAGEAADNNAAERHAA